MNPQEAFCPNIDCPARGQIGKAYITIHSQKEQSFMCSVCQQTFTTTKGTLFYRLHEDARTVLVVIALLAYGCPLQAIVQTFGLGTSAPCGIGGNPPGNRGKPCN